MIFKYAKINVNLKKEESTEGLTILKKYYRGVRTLKHGFQK